MSKQEAIFNRRLQLQLEQASVDHEPSHLMSLEDLEVELDQTPDEPELSVAEHEQLIKEERDAEDRYLKTAIYPKRRSTKKRLAKKRATLDYHYRWLYTNDDFEQRINAKRFTKTNLAIEHFRQAVFDGYSLNLKQKNTLETLTYSEGLELLKVVDLLADTDFFKRSQKLSQQELASGSSLSKRKQGWRTLFLNLKSRLSTDTRLNWVAYLYLRALLTYLKEAHITADYQRQVAQIRRLSKKMRQGHFDDPAFVDSLSTHLVCWSD